MPSQQLPCVPGVVQDVPKGKQMGGVQCRIFVIGSGVQGTWSQH